MGTGICLSERIRMWEMGQESDMFKRSDDILPSDSTLRADLVALVHKDLPQSQRQFNLLTS